MSTPSFLLILTCSLLILFSCTYEPEDINYIDIPTVDANTPDTLNFSFEGDTVYIRGIQEYAISVPETEHRVFGMSVYIDDELIDESHSSSQISINSEYYQNGIHTIKVKVDFKTNSGSLADIESLESVSQEYVKYCIIDNEPAELSNVSFAIEDSILVMTWDAYDDYLFDSLEFRCRPYTCDLETSDPSVTRLEVKDFCGGNISVNAFLYAKNERTDLNFKYQYDLNFDIEVSNAKVYMSIDSNPFKNAKEYALFHFQTGLDRYEYSLPVKKMDREPITLNYQFPIEYGFYLRVYSESHSGSQFPFYIDDLRLRLDFRLSNWSNWLYRNNLNYNYNYKLGNVGFYRFSFFPDSQGIFVYEKDDFDSQRLLRNNENSGVIGRVFASPNGKKAYFIHNDLLSEFNTETGTASDIITMTELGLDSLNLVRGYVSNTDIILLVFLKEHIDTDNEYTYIYKLIKDNSIIRSEEVSFEVTSNTYQPFTQNYELSNSGDYLIAKYGTSDLTGPHTIALNNRGVNLPLFDDHQIQAEVTSESYIYVIDQTIYKKPIESTTPTQSITLSGDIIEIAGNTESLLSVLIELNDQYYIKILDTSDFTEIDQISFRKTDDTQGISMTGNYLFARDNSLRRTFYTQIETN